MYIYLNHNTLPGLKTQFDCHGTHACRKKSFSKRTFVAYAEQLIYEGQKLN